MSPRSVTTCAVFVWKTSKGSSNERLPDESGDLLLRLDRIIAVKNSVEDSMGRHPCDSSYSALLRMDHPTADNLPLSVSSDELLCLS